MNNGITGVSYYVETSTEILYYKTLAKAIAFIKHLLITKRSFVFGVEDSSARIYKDEVYEYCSHTDSVVQYTMNKDTYPTMKYKKLNYIKFMLRLERQLRPIMLRYRK